MPSEFYEECNKVATISKILNMGRNILIHILVMAMMFSTIKNRSVCVKLNCSWMRKMPLPVNRIADICR